MNVVARFAAVALSMLLAGCVTTSGPAGGKPSGQKPTGSAISALGGGLIGGSIGQSLASADKQKALEAEYKALEYTPSNQTVTWTGRRAGERGEVVAAQPYRVGSQDCRQYVHTLYSGDGSQTARGTACRNADGSWSLLS